MSNLPNTSKESRLLPNDDLLVKLVGDGSETIYSLSELVLTMAAKKAANDAALLKAQGRKPFTWQVKPLPKLTVKVFEHNGHDAIEMSGDLDLALKVFGAFNSAQVSKPRPGLTPRSINPGDTAIITGVSMAVADLNTSIDFQIGDKTYRAHDVQLEVEDQADKAKAFWQSLETRLGLTA